MFSKTNFQMRFRAIERTVISRVLGIHDMTAGPVQIPRSSIRAACDCGLSVKNAKYVRPSFSIA